MSDPRPAHGKSGVEYISPDVLMIPAPVSREDVAGESRGPLVKRPRPLILWRSHLFTDRVHGLLESVDGSASCEIVWCNFEHRVLWMFFDQKAGAHSANVILEKRQRLFGSAKGGKAPKKRRWVVELVNQLVAENPDSKPRQIWRVVPEGEGVEVYRDDDVVVEVYRAGDKILQVELDPKTTEVIRQLPVTRRTFQRYVRDAKTRQ